MLFAWLFALAAGIVNACIVEPGLQQTVVASEHDHASAPSLEADAAAPAGTLGQAAPESSDLDAPCLKFCSDEASTLPTLKQASTPWSGLWLAPPPQPLVVSEALAPGVPSARAQALLRREGIPIPIAFLRLAL